MLRLEEASCGFSSSEIPCIDNYLYVLNKIKAERNLAGAKWIQAHVQLNGLHSHVIVGNHIVRTLVECGSLPDAEQAFNRLIHRDVYCCTSLISGYIKWGESQYALGLYQKMQEDCIYPSSYTHVALLKACAMLKDVETGRQIHVEIKERGLEKNVFIGNSLVDMYAKCGSLPEAERAFHNLSTRDTVSWNVLIAGYAENGLAREALQSFESMQLEGISPNVATILCCLKACCILGAVHKGRELHNQLVGTGFQVDQYIGNMLIDLYAKCGSLVEAQDVFEKLPKQDVVSWTALIAGYADSGLGKEALRHFQQMRLEGVPPNAMTFVCSLKACGRIGSLGKGREIHTYITRKGLEKNLFIGNSLVDMYGKCGSLVDAHKVFDKLPIRDVVSWTALIAGYVDNGLGNEALTCFMQMQEEGIYPNAFTFVCSLKACSILGSLEKGQEIHTQISGKGLAKALHVGNTLVDMYAKCGSTPDARKVFDELPVRDVISWNALIAGYTDNGFDEQAVKCYIQMKQDGMCPNVITFICGLKACGNMGALELGREIHRDIDQNEFGKDLLVGATLVDMYAKWGSLKEALEVFNKLPVQNVVSWNAMIRGYGMNHEINKAVQCFHDMQEFGVKPDAVTFICLLTACSRSGLVFKGMEYFKAMTKHHGILPTADHYTCMVDLLARSGNVHDAERLLEALSYPLSIDTWIALLSACKTYGEVEPGLRCFQELVRRSPEIAASNVLMDDFCTTMGKT